MHCTPICQQFHHALLIHQMNICLPVICHKEVKILENSLITGIHDNSTICIIPTIKNKVSRNYTENYADYHA